jgi:trimeric autotransporter adhesin
MRHLTVLVLGLVVISVALAPVNPSYAEDGWTDAGTVVHLTTGSDRVGIGTTTPATKLHVVGDTRFDGTVSTNIISSHPGADLQLRVGGVDGFRLERTTSAPNVIGGGGFNAVLKGVFGATISGGGGVPTAEEPNSVTDNLGTIGGGRGNRAGNNTGTVDDAQGATVGGGEFNEASGIYSTVGGGEFNEASAQNATVAGGSFNDATNANATVGGGVQNQATGYGTTIGGGGLNIANATYSTIGGGVQNVASGGQATIGGGGANTASGYRSTVSGGSDNVAKGDYSTVPGGHRGHALHRGSFVWADATEADFTSRAENQFWVRSTGGAAFVSAVDVAGNPTAGVRLPPGGASWSSASDRNLKENITGVDGADILRRLSAIPITRWNLKAQDPAIKHLGPMAQDFHMAFGLGEDERYINSVDADGIALVSIQALYQIVTALEEKTAAVDRKAADLDRKTADLDRIAAGLEELRARLTRFEQAAEAR